MARVDVTLDRLGRQKVRVQHETDRMATLVQEARAQGASWRQIGDALGVTRQAAQMRYGGPGPVLCAHADSDGEGAHWLAPGERCTQQSGGRKVDG